MMQNWEQNQEQSGEDDDEISRSQNKRDAEALQDIGERLIKLNNAQLNQLGQLDIPEKLLDAVREAKRLTANGAIRRQKQYIGKLMRNTDPTPILEKFAEWDGSSREQAAKFHQLERWRDRLLTDDKAISALVLAHPAADVQRLRTLVRNAHKELAANRPPKSSRELFKELRHLIVNDNTPQQDTDNQQQDTDNQED
ncbi:MAG: ribosome biogenesis factor YjgA [Sulfuricellaceae bacterium]|nr:ribosome biogenesis factor YjgA [Sulfuricellaceae bacterium]